MTVTTADPTAVTIEFTTAMPGLSPYTAFTLVTIAGAEGLYALRALDADLRLFLLDAAAVGRGYAPRIPAGSRAEIGAADTDVLRMFVIANPSDEGVHVNLRAPIVVHPQTGRAAQVILDDQDHPIRALLGG
ncbi:Flagellar assembly factor FliW [Microbacterium oxydans]|uniref:Flagellar assembly factor FliW n=1 Tax=Microbacterium oxydans TaxID=82380 RepID=A0A0F0L8C8_9MICO|nr:flagellar assembly protein FliW [Microbacterium oxydans]KJL27791.1 Flagellar assembly factor FliW [Microbacterium oxydans]CAH0180738.1 Flagellar assembly factor FliW [Microbacterium oxydans]